MRLRADSEITRMSNAAGQAIGGIICDYPTLGAGRQSQLRVAAFMAGVPPWLPASSGARQRRKRAQHGCAPALAARATRSASAIPIRRARARNT